MAKAGNILKVLSIRKEEQSVVYLLLLQTVFLGMFLALFDISTTSLFINAYGESMLSKAFLVSGVVGFGLSMIYYKAQNTWKFSKLVVNNLLFISVVTLLLRVSFYFSDSSVLVFIAFILMGPLNLLGIVGFWGMAGRLFTLRQGKRLFSLIDAGQTFGMILISFLIPVLLNLLTNNKDLLFISSASILVALVIQLIIVHKFDLDKEEKLHDSNANEERKKLKLADIYSNKYLRSMSAYVILSMLAAFYMFYIFLPTTKSLYPGENEFTVFLGMFTGALMIFTFLIKTLAYDKITKNYGIKVNLLLPPFLLGFFVILAILTGFFFGTTPGANSYVLFFLFVALGRLFSVSLKNAIEIPSQKILYQSLDGSIRHKVQVALDGMVNETATISAGVLLFVMGLFDLFTIVHYALFLFAIAIVWIFTALHVHREYKKSLGAALEADNTTNDELQFARTYKDYDCALTEQQNLKRMKINQNLSHIRHEKFSSDLFLNLQPDKTSSIIAFIAQNNIFAALDSMKKNVTAAKIARQGSPINNAIQTLEDTLKKHQSEEQIRQLVASPYPDQRVLAAKIIDYTKNKNLSYLIITLLRDYEPQVKLAAIAAAAQLKDAGCRTILIDLLQDEQYNASCYDALKKYGVDVLDLLEQLFYKSGLKISVQLQIVALYAFMGNAAVEYLINKLDYYTQSVVHAAIQSLISLNYKPKTDAEKQKIIQVLVGELNNLAYNLNITTQTSKKMHGEAILSAFEKERETTFAKIYNLLKLLYNKKSVEQVKKNLDTGTSESISYGLELLDLFVDEEIKQTLFIAFEDISYGEKTRRFQDHFPLPKFDNTELINDVINRDINFISRYTKACAIEDLAKNTESAASDTCIAHIFNKDLMLKQEASIAIAGASREQFTEIVTRTDHQEQVIIEKLLNQTKSTKLFTLVSLTRKNPLFMSLSDDDIVSLIEMSKVIELNTNETIDLCENELDGIVVLDGELALNANSSETSIFTAPVAIDLSSVTTESTCQFIANSHTIILLMPFKKVMQFTNDFQPHELILSKII